MNQAQLQTLLDKQIAGNVHNVVVGLQSQDGRVNLGGAAGVANAQTGAAMTSETPYLIASVTKMYTATVILKLHQQGRLNLDENIAAYLPVALLDGIHTYKGHDYSRQLKVYQLVSQTSGLADYFLDRPKGGQSVFDGLKQGRDITLTHQKVTDIVRGLPPKFEPGAKQGCRAAYADTNYHLLGAIIETVTGHSLAEVYQELIFAPLGLQHTYAYNAAALRPDQQPADLYLENQVVRLPQFFSTNTSDGGLVATVSDSLTFLRAFFSGQLFDKPLFDRMTRFWNPIFFPMQYGYGMMRLNLPRIFTLFRPMPEFIGHSGSTGSFAYYVPAKGLYVAGTVNQVGAPRRAIQLMMQSVMG